VEQRKHIRALTCILCSIILLLTFVPLGLAEESFQMLTADVTDGMMGVDALVELNFTFNHRVDPCDNVFSITGEGVSVSGWRIDGTKLTVQLSAPLGYGLPYLLNLSGLSDIYGEEYAGTVMTFRTKRFEVSDAGFVDESGKLLSEMDSAYTGYHAQITNISADKAVFYVAIPLIDVQSQRMTDLIFEQVSIEPGQTFALEKGFSNLGNKAQGLKAKVFFIQSPETLRPYETEVLQSAELPAKSRTP